MASKKGKPQKGKPGCGLVDISHLSAAEGRTCWDARPEEGENSRQLVLFMGIELLPVFDSTTGRSIPDE
jgi:hypothetical protein